MRIIKIKLGEKDREKFGCPEWMDVDLDELPAQEACELEDAGIDWENLLRGEPLFDPATGEPVLDEDTGRQIHVLRSRTWHVLVWQALRRMGIRLSLADVDFDLKKFEHLRPAEPPKPEPGKGAPRARRSGARGATRKG